MTMAIEQLPQAWEGTRATLQKYAQAMTALPRAGIPMDARWVHVSMALDATGLLSFAVPLHDGTELVSKIDLVDHQIVISTDDSFQVIGLESGPSPRSIGEAVLDAAAAHGSVFDVEEERYSDDAHQEYDSGHAAAFWSVAISVADAFTTINDSIEGEITGPHLWPHGFDIATEWYSEKLVDYNGTPTNAQIATGWYPAGDPYFYVNPWPFDDAWLDIDLPAGAKWNTEGWYGAKLTVSDIANGMGTEAVVALGERVHAITAAALSD
jgi:hypothetical protein